jgi:hypothetical protein
MLFFGGSHRLRRQQLVYPEPVWAQGQSLLQRLMYFYGKDDPIGATPYVTT